MTELFKKLNFKDQAQICVLHAPAEFEAALQAMAPFAAIKREPADFGEMPFVIAFVQTEAEVEAAMQLITAQSKGDAVTWFAFPKGSSKKYKAQINRDRGWQSVGAAGFEPVRGVAIDEDWSALRIRRVEYIKTMTRQSKHALSEAGKQKTSASDPNKAN